MGTYYLHAKEVHPNKGFYSYLEVVAEQLYQIQHNKAHLVRKVAFHEYTSFKVHVITLTEISNPY